MDQMDNDFAVFLFYYLILKETHQPLINPIGSISIISIIPNLLSEFYRTHTHQGAGPFPP
jgi:hypothetical protein